MTIELGVDVGGTFTDIVATTDAGHVRDKVPSDPSDPAGAVIAACELVAADLALSLDGLLAQLTRFGLGTTVVTNVLATRSGRRLGLLTTAGFEDLIPLARGSRVSDGGWLVPPPQLVDRTRIVGVTERIDRDGTVTTPVDVDGAVRAARDLIEPDGGEPGVEAIVVSFLWSFRNPGHEQAVGAAIAAKYPDLPLVLGSELSPVIREYERTQYALLNAYVAGALDWLGPLSERLQGRGLTVPVVLTHSSGGATTVDGARDAPIGLAQSGPAAGAAAAARLARAMQQPQVVTCDLGGTSLDVALIADGEALRRTAPGAVLGHWTSLSMVDVDSVGSGGGSIAWVDAVGAIRVGPRSAGAAPGPACYGRGGTDATLTDALVVLGYLDPARFLGGRMPLDAARAAEACGRIGAGVGLDPVETAWGIREVALAAMARAVRNRIASRGLVAADLTLLAYGGCGGLFGADIAREVGAHGAAVPHLAPVLCAFGAATAPLHRERARSVALRIPAPPGTLEPTLDDLREAVLADLASDGAEPGACTVRLEADVRFERQGAELGIPIPCDAAGRPLVDGLHGEFREEYVRRFGAGAVAVGVAIEVMTLRAIGSAAESGSGEHAWSPAGEAPTNGVVAHSAVQSRPVRLARDGDPVAVPVHTTAGLPAGSRLAGPALVDAGDTTVWIPSRHDAVLDERGTLLIELQEIP